jgi:hypothetical protein
VNCERHFWIQNLGRGCPSPDSSGNPFAKDFGVQRRELSKIATDSRIELKNQNFLFLRSEGTPKYMARCIELAKNGLGTTYPNPLVGAVVV